ncbi:SpoIID/LytB domain-containing protein [Bryobacter aggregatus]|uniref:SpoIID/LytB domain-containing protein n=1 Tax=Bryobacter aggregatus TaxID=360054 RepID=UPI0004E19180|nr:SpoIID/LytB domain-containing protein [Bryobacter aggregatus]
MRFSLALVCLALSAAPRDLKPDFAGRSGSALLFDLETNALAGVWNLPRANTTPFRPGSVLKPFTLAAYIEAGLYRQSDKAPERLAYSDNEYFDKLATRMDKEDLTRGYARFGLNQQATTTTLANLLAAARRLIARSREERLRPVFDGMEQAVEYGTARLAAVSSTQVAGKTGTMRDSAVFLGYAPASRPRYILLIHLDSGSGGGDAAPFAAKIFASLFSTAAPPDDPKSVSIRLFWQNPPSRLNLKPGHYPAGTPIEANTSRLNAPGPLTVALRDGHYLLTTQVPLEAYVAAVLEGEAAAFQHPASLEAMAIAARTYAAHFRVRNARRHPEEGFDYCDTTHCQDARFTATKHQPLLDAVQATEAELLWFNGQPAAAYYHADSGGWLEASSDAPYLLQRRDPWWQDTPASRWTWTIKATQLAQALNLTFITQNFRVRDKDTSGRARSLDVFGHPAEAASFRMAIGRTMGWEKLPSRLFEVKREGAMLTFTGRGRGHGIGMPQNSAEAMAAKGKTREQILAEYYPGTRISPAASGLSWRSLKSPRITLYTTNLTRDKALLAEADRELPLLEALTGFKVNPTLRVFPTREAFRDATGISTKVQGATRGRDIKLPPNPSLATLRHELLHAILESNTKISHPEWFREGLVQALLNEKSPESDRAAKLIYLHGKKHTISYWINGLP